MANDRFQFGLFGYNKKDVDVRFDAMREEFDREKAQMAAEQESLNAKIRELKLNSEELNKRNEEFEEVEKSVFSIMNVTQRAGERIQEETKLQRDRIVEVATNSAQEIANVRQEIMSVRENMNDVLSKLQNRLDTINDSLTGTVNALVSVKHDILSDKISSAADIQNEVDQLLRLAESGGVSRRNPVYKVPQMGDFSKTLISNSAQKVMNSRQKAYEGIASDQTADGSVQLSEIEKEMQAIANAVENTDSSSMPDIKLLQYDKSLTDGDQKVYLDPESTDAGEPVIPASIALSDPGWFTSSVKPAVQKSGAKVKVKVKVRPIPSRGRRN